jgi:hypothetical protein
MSEKLIDLMTGTFSSDNLADMVTIPEIMNEPESPFIKSNMEVDYTKGTISYELINPMGRTITREIIATKEAYTRQALIEMGWTPPPEEGS